MAAAQGIRVEGAAIVRSAAPAPTPTRLSGSDLRKLEKEVARLEQRVADLESLQAKLTAELADPATYAQGAKVQQLNAELQATTEALQTATNDWEKAAQRLSEEKR